jgi:large subunit ribosomal protein L7/L12
MSHHQLTNEQLVEALNHKTIPEIVALTHALEDAWGVKAVPQVQAGPMPPPPKPPDEVQTEFAVVINEVGPKKIEIIKSLRAVLNLGLAEAKAWVEAISGPKVVKEGLTKKDAEEIQAALVQAGAVVVLK